MIRLFRVFVPTSVVGVLLSEIVLAFFCYALTSLLVLEIDPVIDLLYGGGAWRITLVVLSIIIGIYFTDLYEELRPASRVQLVQQYCLVIGIAFLAQALLSYGNRNWVLSRRVMLYGSGVALVLLPGWRLLYASVAIQAASKRRILFLGDDDLVREIAEGMERQPFFGWTSLGYLSDKPAEEVPPRELGPRLGGVADMVDIARAKQPDMIVVGLSERRGCLPVMQLLDLRLEGLAVDEAAAVYEKLFGRVAVKTLRPSHLVFGSSLGPNRRNVALQDVYSITIALAVLVVLLPLMAIVALLILATSPGPVLYRQRRVGLRGREFDLYKFRSMRVDAEQATGAVWAAPVDPRTTAVGRWLRRLRLDELPQLFNVLRGEMAIAGPRPERPEFVRTLSEQIPFYPHRHCVKPGITGWAQIKHRYGDTVEDTVSKLEYDLYYIKNLGPALDFFIMFHTAKVMLLWRGAR